MGLFGAQLLFSGNIVVNFKKRNYMFGRDDNLGAGAMVDEKEGMIKVSRLSVQVSRKHGMFKWDKENKKLATKAEKFLEEFYKDCEIEPGVRFKTDGEVGGFRIHSDTEDYNPIIEEEREFTEKEKQIRAKKVEKYRAEMNEFTNFLKDKYFEK